jgi:hypothetical protein
MFSLLEKRVPSVPCGGVGYLRSALHRATASIEAASFWSAVALPLVYVPLIVTGSGPPLLLGALVALNALALVLGHGHVRERGA